MKSRSAMLLVIALCIAGTIPLGRRVFAGTMFSSFESGGGDTQPSATEQQIVTKEREGLDALRAGNLQRFADLTDEDAIFIDSQGPATKAQVVKNVAGFRLTEYSMDNLKFVSLSKDSGLITYTIHEKGISHGKEFDTHAYVSSLWTKKGKNWLCIFSQETGARQPGS
jgi:ketosteroid isomerase-like protein